MRSEARRGHDDQSVHEAYSAECTDVSEWPLSAPDHHANTVYAHGFVVLCFVVVMQSSIMNSHKVFIHIHQGCFAGTGAIVRLPQCQRSKPDGYGKISQCITTTKHSKAKPVWIFLGIYCIPLWHELFGFDSLRIRNLQAKLRSGRWRILHCRKAMLGFVGDVQSNDFVTS